MQFQAGDIIFFRGDGVISKLVKFFDKGEFSHVAIAISDTQIFHINWNFKAKVDYLYTDNCEIVKLNLPKEKQQRLAEIISPYKDSEYDYLQIAWYILKYYFHISGANLFNYKKRLICSELVSHILFDLGVIDKVDYLYDLTPNQLYDTVTYLLKHKGDK